jgi:hypothetical protein
METQSPQPQNEVNTELTIEQKVEQLRAKAKELHDLSKTLDVSVIIGLNAPFDDSHDTIANTSEKFIAEHTSTMLEHLKRHNSHAYKLVIALAQ